MRKLQAVYAVRPCMVPLARPPGDTSKRFGFMRDYTLKLSFDELDMVRLCVRQMLDDLDAVAQLVPQDSAALVQADEVLENTLENEGHQ